MIDTGHGEWTLSPGELVPFVRQDGWRDWHLLPLELPRQMPKGLDLDRGRLRIDLSANVSIEGFEVALYEGLRRYRLAEVTTMPRWLVAQSAAGRPVVISPRYTLRGGCDFCADASRLDDLFVLDPMQHGAFVALLILQVKELSTSLTEEAPRHG